MATFFLGALDGFIHSTLNTLRGTNHVAVTGYFGLIVAGPGDSAGGTLTELTTVDYTTRQACGFSAPAARQMSNSGAITLSASSTVAWNGGAPIKRFGIWSANSGGVCQWVEEISPVLI